MRKGWRSTKVLELTPEAMNEYDAVEVSHASNSNRVKYILHQGGITIAPGSRTQLSKSVTLNSVSTEI